jgi:hypothetical protein
MLSKEIIVFGGLMVLASARKIGVTNPIAEIIAIFVTLTGVSLLLLALMIYLH